MDRVVDAEQVTVTVTDHPTTAVATATALAGSGGGYGLTGMRERAAQLGGTLAAGPDAGGWRVRVSLPVGEAG